MDFLRDPLWQFVGAAVAVVALLVSLVVALLQRQRKRLEYEIETDTPVLTMREELSGRLRVLLDGDPVEDLDLVVIRFANRGNVPIRAVDYERSLGLTFGESAQILSAEVTDQQPSNLAPTVTFDSARVTVQPLLLNKGDSLSVKCLVARSSEIIVDGRIVGVSSIRQFTGIDSPLRVAAGLLGFLLFIGGMIGGSRLPVAEKVASSAEVAFVMVSMTGVVFMAFALPFRLIARYLLGASLGVEPLSRRRRSTQLRRQNRSLP